MSSYTRSPRAPRAGRRSEAFRSYHSCERALWEELDVAPGPETRTLYEQIKVGKFGV